MKRTLIIFGSVIGSIILIGMLWLVWFLQKERYDIKGGPVIYPNEISVNSDSIDIHLCYESSSAVFLRVIPRICDDEMKISIAFRLYTPFVDDDSTPNPYDIRIPCNASDIEKIYFVWPGNEVLIWPENEMLK